MKVIAAVIAAVALLEGTARTFAPVLDWDRAHIHQFPELVAELHRQTSPRIVFFGNSLMLHGLDLDSAVSGLNAATGLECHAEKIVPVGTAVVDWIYLYDTYFTRVKQPPDAIVIGFVAHHVQDVEEVKIRRLARHFCSADNLWPCLADELDSFEMRALGFWSYQSAIFGDQQEIQLRILSPIVPYYNDGTRQVNRLLERAAGRRANAAGGDAQPPQTYLRLAHLIAELDAAGVRAFFVPMPQPDVWELDPELVRTIEDGGMTIIDARQIESITEDDFYDGYHLDEAGKSKLSQFLGREVGGKLRPAP